MKKLFLFISILIQLQSFAQIDVSPSFELHIYHYPLSEQQFADFKSTSTVFVIRDSEESMISEITEMLNSIWTVTNFKVITYKTFISEEVYKSDEFSFMTLGGHVESHEMNSNNTNTVSGGTYSAVRVYMLLWKNVVAKNGIITNRKYSRIELFPSATICKSILAINKKNYAEFYPFSYENRGYRGMNFIDILYEDSLIYNYNWSFLKNYLQVINSELVNNNSRWYAQEDVEVSEIENLKTQVLYVPDYIFNKTGEYYAIKSIIDSTKILAKYPYPIKIVSTDLLETILQQSEDPIYYLIFVRSGSTKFITIFNSATGKIIYNCHEFNKFNISSSDFSKLAGSIKHPHAIIRKNASNRILEP